MRGVDTARSLELARTAFSRRAWSDAYAWLCAVDLELALGAADLEQMGVAAQLIGRETEGEHALARAHNAYWEAGRCDRAARCAFWLGMTLLDRGEVGRGGGWLARSRRAVEDHRVDCVEVGYLLVPDGLQRNAEGDYAAAQACFDQAAEIARRFADADLVTLARLGQGQARMQMGDLRGGLRMFDEVMVAVTAGEVSPIPAGIVYCAVIAGCNQCCDFRRAQEWTAALTDWCASQPDLVPFRGQCLLHRAQMMQWHGSWTDALREAQRAGEWLSRPTVRPAVGAAFYQQAEIRRLRGELPAAEDAYHRAHQAGHDVQPGLAQLRLAQGLVGAAEAGIRRVVETESNRWAELLPAYTEIMLAAGDVDAARTGADRLRAIAADTDTPMLSAAAAYANGAVLLVEGQPAAAMTCVREAASSWQALEVPYEVARARVLLARACRAVGDEDTAQLEIAAAARSFKNLGARSDLKRALLVGSRGDSGSGPLTPREREVLRLVAAGKTNRVIARELFLSEKTVARHLSNIFTKLGVSTRSAATAYAYRQHLV